MEKQIIYGEFDGQGMLTDEGKCYPIPSNYASKSRLLVGDQLKLIITDEGDFIYKQIKPQEQKRMIGVAEVNDDGEIGIRADNRFYKIILASANYYKIKAGDEVLIIVPRYSYSDWAAVDGVITNCKKQYGKGENFEEGTATDSVRSSGLRELLGD